MGPEIIAAIIAPILTGTISMSIYLNKRSSDSIAEGFEKLHVTVQSIEQKVDDLRIDVAKNYVTNDVLTAHIKGEEDWHVRFGGEMQQMRDDVTTTRVIVDKMWMDFQNKGNM